MKKILVITHRSYPVIGGIESHVYKYCKFISSHKFPQNVDLDITNLSYSSESDKVTVVNKNFRLITYKTNFIISKSYPILSPIALFKTLKYILKYKPDVIHTHNRYMISTWVGIIIAKIMRIKVIHTEHASNWNCFSNKGLTLLSKFLDLTLIRFLLMSCNKITAVSLASKNFLNNKLSLKKDIEIISNFIDTDEIDKILTSETKIDISQDARNVLFAGRLVETKGYKDFIKFIKELNVETNLRFIVVGDGPGEKEIVDISKNPNIIYLGALSYKDMILTMNQCSIILNLSSLEGYSTTLLEAMYLKKKIVSTNIDANKEVLRGYPLRYFVDVHPTLKNLETALIHASKDTRDCGDFSKSLVKVLPNIALKYSWSYSID